ncbi:MAG TPA: ERF family protein [Streptosporangiaceae bacterium]|nr:ERF family protein [Streptosporangiaceae bacterium]
MTDEVMSSPTIFELFAEAKRRVGPVGKDGYNTHQKYNFRGIDAVVNATAAHFDDLSIITVPGLVDEQHAYVEIGANKSRMVHTHVKVQYTFYGPAGDFFSAIVPGEAMDSGDKSTPKAMSVAYRIALLQCLNLPTSDPDPDSQSYELSKTVPDDGDWYGWRDRLDALKTIEDCQKFEADLRKAAFGEGGELYGQPEKAGNIRLAWLEKAREIAEAAKAIGDQEAAARAPDEAGRKPDTVSAEDPELARLLLAAAEAKTIPALKKVRDDAEREGKLTSMVPVASGGTQSLAMVLYQRRTILEAETVKSEQTFAEANAGVAGS